MARITGPTYPTPEKTKQALTRTYGIAYDLVQQGAPIPGGTRPTDLPKEEMVEVTVTRQEGPGQVQVTKMVPISEAKKLEQQMSTGQQFVRAGVQTASMGGPDVVITPAEAVEQKRHMERVEAERARPDYQAAFAAKKIVTFEASAGAVSVVLAGLRGRGAEEAEDWRSMFVSQQREEISMMLRGKKDKVFWGNVLETAPAVVFAGLGAAFQGVKIGATGAKLMTGLGAGLTAVGGGIAVIEAPKLTIKGQPSRSGAGLLMMGAGLVMAKGGLDAMKATKTKEEYGEVLAVRREEIVPKGTLKQIEGYATKTQTTKGFGLELEREIAPQNLFSEGKLVESKGMLEMWKLKGDYFMVSRAVSGKAVSGKGVIDVIRTDKQSFLKATGIDVFMKESISKPITFDTGSFKVQVASGSSPTGTSGLKSMGSLKQTFKAGSVAVMTKISPRITTSIAPTPISLSATGLKERQSFKLQPVQVSLSKTKIKQDLKVTPISLRTTLTQREKRSTPFKTTGMFLTPTTIPTTITTTTPTTTTTTTPRITTPTFKLSTPMMAPPFKPITTRTDRPGMPPFIPLFDIGLATTSKRKRGKAKGRKRKTRYTPSIAGLSLKTGFKKPKFELGIRIRGKKR